MDAIAALTDAALHNPQAATLIAFLAAIVEAVAVLGLVIPGTPVLMAVAAAAAAAGLPIGPILVAGVAGAVIGDGFSYWIGARYGGCIRNSWPFTTRPLLIGRAETFFARFGTLSVALARFIPVLRSTVPLVAGMAGMPRRRFVVANVLSALVWAPAHVFPAQLVGSSVARISWGDWEALAPMAAALPLIAGAGWMLHWLGRRWLGEQ